MNGADPLGDDENGGKGQLLCQRFAESRIGFEIKSGKAVVKNIQIRFFHQCPGYGKPLLLPA